MTGNVQVCFSRGLLSEVSRIKGYLMCRWQQQENLLSHIGSRYLYFALSCVNELLMSIQAVTVNEYTIIHMLHLVLQDIDHDGSNFVGLYCPDISYTSCMLNMKFTRQLVDSSYLLWLIHL